MPRFYRWANRDPIKFAGGSNTYQYVTCPKDLVERPKSGNPVKYVDPTGLASVKNNSPRPIIVGGNRGMFTGSGSHVDDILLMPGESCNIFNPRDGVRDVDAIDFDDSGSAADPSVDDSEKIPGYSLGGGGHSPFGSVEVICKPGSYGPGCEIQISN